MSVESDPYVPNLNHPPPPTDSLCCGAGAGSGNGNVVFNGVGSPEGVQTGNVGDLYEEFDGGGVFVRQWVKGGSDGTNTGWE